MAGYIFNLDSEESLVYCIENGIYGTNFKKIPDNNIWRKEHEGTFADYLSMKEQDNIYFFRDRMIYGIGKLINVGHDCKYLNFPNSDLPYSVDFFDIKDSMLINQTQHNVNTRCMCTFHPSPHFFKRGIDMDDVLSSNPSSFRMLRAYWKTSFIKIDDEENKALKDIILKRNEEFINQQEGIFCSKIDTTSNIKQKVNGSYSITSENLLSLCSHGKVINHEMAIEAGIIDVISQGIPSPFGSWDYVSRQVVASPFKPIDYMDRMDVFGYKYINGFDTISKYLIIEIKKGPGTFDAIDQIMKYVDWVNQEYSYGDYSMVNAFLVCSGFSKEVIDYKYKVCKRNYIKGRRPAISDEWSNVRLIKYEFDSSEKKLRFVEIK
ncbi:hypothetical protein [Bacillus sp. RO1]|uniref:hypothetical protein n=1 Tax=Bacillus sp. RO1 TaxID=2722703 RepID=UPI00197CA520|nr:hypothetical protein [Bacillus sp. RO1]